MAFSNTGFYSENVTNRQGYPQRNLGVSVYPRGSSVLATLYADRLKASSLANPTATDAKGNLSFYANPGDYDLVFVGDTALYPITIQPDPAEIDAETTTGPTHDLVGPAHVASGLTIGHILRATAANAFAFGALLDSDIPASIARDSEITAHEAAADPHTGYQREVEKAAANGYASLDANTRIPTAQVPYKEMLAVFSKGGTLVVGVGTGRFRFPFAATLVGVTAAINTQPTGAAVILDVNKNGTTIFTTQGNRPTIAVSTNATTAEPTPDVTAIASGDELRVDIDQIGSTVAGADLTVFVRYLRTGS